MKKKLIVGDKMHNMERIGDLNRCRYLCNIHNQNAFGLAIAYTKTLVINNLFIFFDKIKKI